ILRSAEARATPAWPQETSRVDQDLFDALLIPLAWRAAEIELLHVRVNFRRTGHNERGNLDLVPLEDVGREDHVVDFAAGAASNVGAVKLHATAIPGSVLVVR